MPPRHKTRRNPRPAAVDVPARHAGPADPDSPPPGKVDRPDAADVPARHAGPADPDSPPPDKVDRPAAVDEVDAVDRPDVVARAAAAEIAVVVSAAVDGRTRIAVPVRIVDRYAATMQVIDSRIPEAPTPAAVARADPVPTTAVTVKGEVPAPGVDPMDLVPTTVEGRVPAPNVDPADLAPTTVEGSVPLGTVAPGLVLAMGGVDPMDPVERIAVTVDVETATRDAAGQIQKTAMPRSRNQNKDKTTTGATTASSNMRSTRPRSTRHSRPARSPASRPTNAWEP